MLLALESIHEGKGILYYFIWDKNMTSMCNSTKEEARMSYHVRACTRPASVMFVYVLGEMCMLTGSLPIEPNKKGHVGR